HKKEFLIAPCPDYRSHSYGDVMPLTYMPKDAVWETDDGVFLRVFVKPKSTLKKLISDYNEDMVVVNLKSPAREGKANAELLKRMSKALGLSTGNVRLVAGLKSREKILLISGMELKAVVRKIAEIARAN
ncbi:MAG: DUF167 domain-containing protein, partial [Candidatus Thorarchaeota archaeon]